jgi:hypothetical protein
VVVLFVDETQLACFASGLVLVSSSSATGYRSNLRIFLLVRVYLCMRLRSSPLSLKNLPSSLESSRNMLRSDSESYLEGIVGILNDRLISLLVMQAQ